MINGKQVHFYDSELLPNDELGSIYDLIIDESGLLWISLWGEGVYKQIPNKAFYSYGHSLDGAGYTLSHPEVLSVRTSEMFNNVIWVGTSGSGLNVLDKLTGRIRDFRDVTNGTSIGSGEILAIEESSSGVLWVASENGIEYARNSY